MLLLCKYRSLHPVFPINIFHASRRRESLENTFIKYPFVDELLQNIKQSASTHFFH